MSVFMPSGGAGDRRTGGRMGGGQGAIWVYLAVCPGGWLAVRLRPSSDREYYRCTRVTWNLYRRFRGSTEVSRGNVGESKKIEKV